MDFLDHNDMVFEYDQVAELSNIYPKILRVQSQFCSSRNDCKGENAPFLIKRLNLQR